MPSLNAARLLGAPKFQNLALVWIIASCIAVLAVFAAPTDAFADATQKKDTNDLADAEDDESTDTEGDDSRQKTLVLIDENSSIKLVEEIEKNLVQDDYDPDLTGDLGIDPDSIDLTGRNLSDLPCLSVGAAARGRLINGVELKSFPGLRARNHPYNWGTPELIAGLHYAVAKVRRQYPDTADLVSGDVARKTGGRLKRHKSHQSGRDIDVGYYFKGNAQQQYFVDATPKNMDAEKTWAFIEALLDDNKIQYIFIDYNLQRPLYNHVKYKKKAPNSYLDAVFQYPRGPRTRLGIIRHARGHRHHMHVRFWSPIALTAARKNNFHNAQLDKLKYLGPTLPDNLKNTSLQELEKYDWGPAPKYQTIKVYKEVRLTYRVRKGDTLGHIARKVGVGTRDLMRWNKMSGRSIIRPGQGLKYYKKKLVDVEVEVFPADKSKIEIAKEAPKEPVNVAQAKSSAAGSQAQYKIEWKNKWTKVKSGDNLWNIARRNNTTVDKLCKLNGIGKSTVLRPGQKLKVKVYKKKIPLPPPPEPEPQTVVADAAPPEPEAVEVAVADEDSVVEETPKATPSFLYRVTKGDCIYNLSQRFNLKVADICSWNNIPASTKLKAGQTLTLHLPETASEAKSGEGKSEESAKLDL